MGQFTNKKYVNTIDSLVKANLSKLENPYYIFTDQKPTKVTYYNQNTKKSTVDRGSQMNYAHVSSQSALKMNKILDFFLYGIERIAVDYDVQDNGLEANPISGDAIVLPNTIIPYAGDFFSISYVKEDLLFKVDAVTPDTLDSGANIYKLEYHLELVNSIKDIEKQVDSTFNFIINNVGTEFNPVILSTEYDLADKLEGLLENLISYYNGIFFKPKVQSYTYLYDGAWHFYDPFMIEFIRKNNLMSGDKYVYVAHQTHVPATFPFEYAHSLFHYIETRDKDNIDKGVIATADVIEEINSLFTSRIEDYYQIRYIDNMEYKTRFNILDQDVVNHIKFFKKYDSGDDRSVYNILISYMNKDSKYINESIINEIHKLDFSDNKESFYLIPIYIYIISAYIKDNIMSKQVATIN